MSTGPASRMIGRGRAWVAGHRAQIFFGVVILWVIGVFLLISFEPETGESSPAALRAAVRSSVTAQDADRFGRLFAPGTAGDDYPALLLARLTDAGAQAWSFELRTGERRELVLSGRSGCVGWTLTRADGRWYLDGVPPLIRSCSG